MYYCIGGYTIRKTNKEDDTPTPRDNNREKKQNATITPFLSPLNYYISNNIPHT